MTGIGVGTRFFVWRCYAWRTTEEASSSGLNVATRDLNFSVRCSALCNSSLLACDVGLRRWRPGVLDTISVFLLGSGVLCSSCDFDKIVKIVVGCARGESCRYVGGLESKKTLQIWQLNGGGVCSRADGLESKRPLCCCRLTSSCCRLCRIEGALL